MVGPAPLRRLSNQEYLNALQDLFPALHPELPALPSDGDVAGFENAAEAQKPSDLRIARFEAIANLYAEGLTHDTASVGALVGCDWATGSKARACAKGFIADMGGRLFRRPLTPDERQRFGARFERWSIAVDFEAAVRLTLSAMLQSPQFLYRPEPVPKHSGSSTPIDLDSYAMATRLSFFLWESVPSDELLAAAARDELRRADQIRTQAESMLRDDRARRVYWSFHRQWLGLDRILDEEHTLRTAEVDPAWSTARQQSAGLETQRFVENTLADSGSLRDLLISRRAWLDDEMAVVYGVTALAAEGQLWSEVALPKGERAGLLTRTAFLAGSSHRGGTSPPIRGNAIQSRFLCRLPLSPPPDANLNPPSDMNNGAQTNRMLFEARTRPPACYGCHVGLNGFGFGFENYTASGAFAMRDHGLPIDARGRITATDVDGEFEGAIELSEELSRSRTVHRCATQQWLRYALGRAPTDEEGSLIESLTDGFMQGDRSVKDLLLAIVTAPSFRMRAPEDGT